MELIFYVFHLYNKKEEKATYVWNERILPSLQPNVRARSRARMETDVMKAMVL